MPKHPYASECAACELAVLVKAFYPEEGDDSVIVIVHIDSMVCPVCGGPTTGISKERYAQEYEED